MKWLPVVDVKRCTGCGRCVKVCGLDLRRVRNDISVMDNPERCPGEGICVVGCPAHALTMEWVPVSDDGEGEAA